MMLTKGCVDRCQSPWMRQAFPGLVSAFSRSVLEAEMTCEILIRKPLLLLLCPIFLSLSLSAQPNGNLQFTFSRLARATAPSSCHPKAKRFSSMRRWLTKPLNARKKGMPQFCNHCPNYGTGDLPQRKLRS